MYQAIVAMTEDMVIGRNGTIPWHLPKDMKLFKQKTLGHTVLMGRTTYQSIVDALGMPLPGRRSVVLSTTLQPHSGVAVVRSIDEALTSSDPSDTFICGGGSVYEAFLPFIDRLHVSWVKEPHQGDTFFPRIDLAHWDITNKEHYKDFDYVEYRRR